MTTYNPKDFYVFSWPTGLTLAFNRLTFAEDNVISVGISFTHPNDKFNRAIGKMIAINRARYPISVENVRSIRFDANRKPLEIRASSDIRGRYYLFKELVVGKNGKIDRNRLLAAVRRELVGIAKSTINPVSHAPNPSIDFIVKAVTRVNETTKLQKLG